MAAGERPWKRWVLLGGAMWTLSRGFEAMGDAAPFAEDGVSTERLVFHVLALVLLLGTAVCFFKVLRACIGMVQDRSGGPAREAARVFAPDPKSAPLPQAPGEFDPDAAFARYMERKSAGEIEPVMQAPPPRGGFGRKGA